MRRKHPLRTVLLALPLVALVVIQLFPVAVVLLTSITAPIDLLRRGPFGFGAVFFGNFEQVLVKDGFLSPLANSAIIASASTVISVLFGGLAAYGLTRFHFRGRRVLTMSFLCARIVPPIALAVPAFLLLKALGATDTLAGLTLAHTTFNLPFAVWLLLPFFDGLPVQIEEAALVDGCSRFQLFARVVVPLAVPGLMVAGIFCFLLSWNDFLFSLILAGSSVKTAPLTVNAYMTGFGPEWGPMTAASVVILIPVFAFSFALQKHIIGGVTAGGLKG